jgi:hypothetical protein
MGQGIFKMFKLVDGSMKPLNVALGKRDPTCIVSQQWVPSDPSDSKERLLLGTNDGEIIMMEVREGCGMGHGRISSLAFFFRERMPGALSIPRMG